jgi:hypothetical protein
MSRRTKTLIAAIVIVFFWLPFYALFIMGLARHLLPGAPWYLALLFYALAGTLDRSHRPRAWMYRELRQEMIDNQAESRFERKRIACCLGQLPHPRRPYHIRMSRPIRRCAAPAPGG